MWYQEDLANSDFRIEYQLKAGIKPESHHTARAMRIHVEYVSRVTKGVKSFEKNTRTWSKDVSLVHDFITIPDNDVQSIRSIRLVLGDDVILEPMNDDGALVILSCPQCRLYWSTTESQKEHRLIGPWKVRARRGWCWWIIVTLLVLIAAGGVALHVV